MTHPYPQAIVEAAERIYDQLRSPLEVILSTFSADEMRQRIEFKRVDGMKNGTKFFHHQYVELLVVVGFAEKLSQNQKIGKAEAQEIVRYWDAHQDPRYRGFWWLRNRSMMLRERNEADIETIRRYFE